ncbi:hypothetical protein GCM10009609_30080 [Pseudonocardia aurantiaca]|uniref:GAP family protein n=1 Tax=Pseudonocardia aurantiaca TaxID=75290 RepID=A0ABW4FUW9_9PSEU
MSPEALILAVSAIVRPTSTAAVVAMLSTRRPQQLLVAYVLAGLAFSIAIGTLVVVLLHGFGPAGSHEAGRRLIGTALGVVALCYAGAVWVGWLPRPRAETAHPATTWMRRHMQDLSPSNAAAAGVLTHLPGLVYLTALNAIVGDATSTLDSIVQVVVYNAIWFSMPVVALVVSVHRPSEMRDLLTRMTSWARRHRRAITVVFFGALGAYLLVACGPVGPLPG